MIIVEKMNTEILNKNIIVIDVESIIKRYHNEYAKLKNFPRNTEGIIEKNPRRKREEGSVRCK